MTAMYQGEKWYQEQLQRGVSAVYLFFSNAGNHFQESSGVTGISNTRKAVCTVKIPVLNCIVSFFSSSSFLLRRCVQFITYMSRELGKGVGQSEGSKVLRTGNLQLILVKELQWI